MEESTAKQLPPPTLFEIIDACTADEVLRNDKDAILKAMDALLGRNQTDAILAILDSKAMHRLELHQQQLPTATTIVSKSVTLCRGSSSSRKKDSDYYYLCSYHPGRLVYCSCRSFQEKRKHNSTGSTTMLCKHLWALRLLPLLVDESSSNGVVVDKYESPHDFSQAVRRKLAFTKR